MSSPESESIHITTPPERTGDEGAPRPTAGGLPEVLPVLGLSDIVVFPGMGVPLLVESASSIRLIDEVVAGDRFIALVLQKRADIKDPKPADLWSIGCAGRVQRMLKFPDNTVRVLVEGLSRVAVGPFTAETPYLKAKCRELAETVEASVEVAAMVRNVREQFTELIDLSSALSEQVKVALMNTEEPGRLADFVASHLNLSLEERQRLLETPDVKQRLGLLLPLLSRELEVGRLGSKIQKEVSSSMAKSQRDYFLREQIRAIQRELGEGEDGNSEVAALRAQVEQAQLPEEPKKVALKELDRLQQIPTASAEYTVSRNYLDWIVNLPWAKSTTDKLDLKAAERILDEQHYGLRKVKDRLIEFLAVLKLRQTIRGPILCLVGPPGVGKTSLGRSVAEALGRKFIRIALGGMRDEAEIRGHRRTYVGALPGRFIQSLRRVESNNPVILLDELDKVGADFRGDPASALLEVLDPAQNHTFTDHYLDVPFDLSRVLFITTANWLDPVHVALRDRLEVIELPSYTDEEKLQIALRHLVPRQLEEHGLTRRQVRIGAPTLRRLIRDYTREAGVRQLEREIASLARKAARRLVARGGKRPLVFRPSDLASHLGPVKFLPENAEPLRAVGIAIGLAWTPVGGEILFIEATRMPGSNKLLLTGSLGEVMKESATTALSYLRSQADTLHLTATDFEKHDIHIHVPAGATPKDGPSAGLTIVVALASLLTRRLVRSDLAMTGEISLRGRVLPVGGIKEKTLAAARAGIGELILPSQNRKDWHEVPAEVRSKMKVHFVSRIGEALKLALRPASTRPPRPARRRQTSLPKS
ncbi:MAG: endopeptidase La [Verrucomicrobia bacterium]|nr:endopeptidase La [Verrucomicrobiota bacterium]